MTHTTQSILALLERAHQNSAKPEVIERLRWFAHFTEHGSVSKTCNKFSIARTTFYRWYNRLDAKNLSTLENVPKSRLLKESSHSNHNCLLCSLRQKLTHKPTAFFAVISAIINISIFFFIALPQVAGAASSWAPTLIVNTEAFQIIDDTNSAANLYLQFGGSLNKRLTYDRTLASFIFDDDLEVIGTISGATIHAQDHLSTSGSLAVESGIYGAGLTDCDTVSTDKLLWNADDGTFSCGTDQRFSGTGSLQNFFDNRYVETAGDTMTGTLLIDQNANSISLDIDSEATTADIINISAATLTTGKAIDIGDANALTTGTGLIFTGISNSSNTGKRSLFHLENDHADADSTTVMHLQQDGAATTFLADTDGNGIAIDVDSEATSEPGLRISMPTPNASENPHILFGYENIFDTNLFRDTYNSLTTSGSLAIDPPGLNGTYNFNSVSYTDNLAEARTTGGTAFTVFAAENPSNDLFYVGMDDPFYTIYFDLAVAGAGITFDVEYWNGSAWTVIGYRDTTSNLTQDGTVTFVNPHNWATTTVDTDPLNKYWVRLNSAGDNITTAPTAYSVSPTTDYRFKVFSNAADAQPAIFVSNDQKVGIKTNTPETELEIIGTASGRILHGQDKITGSGTLTINGKSFMDQQVGIGTRLLNEDSALEISHIGDTGSGAILALKSMKEALSAGDVIGQLNFATLDEATEGDPFNAVLIQIAANENWSSTNRGTEFSIVTTEDGTSVPVTNFLINGAGYVGINSGAASEQLDVWGEIEFNMQTSADTTIGMCKNTADGSGTNTEFRECNGTPSDVAEFFETEVGTEPGDIVSVTNAIFTYTETLSDPLTGLPMIYSGGTIVTTIDDFDEDQRVTKQSNIAILSKSKNTIHNKPIGIISTNPSAVYGRGNMQKAVNPQPVAIAGRVPVKVTSENGPIHIGDSIAIASSHGHGMKAISAGWVVGTALEEFTCAKEKHCTGTIMALLNITWFEPYRNGSDALGMVEGKTAVGFDSKNWNSGSNNFAEWFRTADPGMTTGDLTCLDGMRPGHVKRCNTKEQRIIGIVSANSGLIGSNSALIVLMGQLTVKTTGPIKIGDGITLSHIDGVGKKAVHNDEQSICIAMQNSEGDDVRSISCLMSPNLLLQ